MFNLDFFFPDKLIVESSGAELRAQPEKQGKIIVNGDQVAVSVDDVLVRKLSNGIVERYSVLDASYQASFGHDLPAITTLKVQKSGTKPRTGFASQITYNVTGPNARVNVQSHDASTNVVNVSADQLFADLKTAIRAGTLTSDEKTALLGAVELPDCLYRRLLHSFYGRR